MKKYLMVCSLIALLVFIPITIFAKSALSHKFFTLRNYGEKEEVFGSIGSTHTLYVGAVVNDTSDSTLGLSLSKKGVFGYSIVSRCNPSVKNSVHVECTWNNRNKGSYKGTVVINSKADYVSSISGDLQLLANN